MSDLADDLAGTLAVSVWRRASQAQTLAVAISDMEGQPLNELQISYIAQALMSAFDGLQADFAHHLSAEAGLRTGRMNWLLGHDIGGPQ